MNDIRPNEIIKLYLFLPDNYIKRCGLKEKSRFKTCVNKFQWGVRDQKDQTKVEYRLLKDLSSDHLLNILITEFHTSILIKKVIKSILKERHNIGDE